MSRRLQLLRCSSCGVVRATEVERPLPSVNGTQLTPALGVVCDLPVNAYGKTCKGTLLELALGDFLTAAQRAEPERASGGGA